MQNEDEDMIKEWIGNGANMKFELIYRATRDGFSAAKFHEICNN